MENYSLLMGAAAVMKMAVEMAAVSMEKPSGGTSPSGGAGTETLSPDLGFAMAAATEESKGNSFEHTHNGAGKGYLEPEYECLLPFLPGNGARKVLDVYGCFYSCRQCWASKSRGL
ncbi:hypothetical protein QYE76_013747 [Lolium multiflorum]|uniref:Uncharacterized protein n=1 Tax=Lolium multiflorum TaxID=4521 RepID=A0AAD8U3P4_LOLMU|nr:hypothetical protein QYE76_013747 [Lolium multiflorum]